jgi:Ca2+-binding EF-hand superfamily protein
MAGTLESGLSSIEFALNAVEGFTYSSAEAVEAANRLNQIISRLQTFQGKLQSGSQTAPTLVPIIQRSPLDARSTVAGALPFTKQVSPSDSDAPASQNASPDAPLPRSMSLAANSEEAMAIHTASQIEATMVEKARMALERNPTLEQLERDAIANNHESGNIKSQHQSLINAKRTSNVKKSPPLCKTRAILPVNDDGVVSNDGSSGRKRSMLHFFKELKEGGKHVLTKAKHGIDEIHHKVDPDWGKENRLKLTEKERSLVKKAFEAIDVNGDGSLALEELYSVLACMGIKVRYALIHSTHTLHSYTPLIHSSHTLHSYTPLIHSTHTLYYARFKPTVHELHALMAEFDVDGDGSIGLNEFCEVMASIKG